MRRVDIMLTLTEDAPQTIAALPHLVSSQLLPQGDIAGATYAVSRTIAEALITGAARVAVHVNSTWRCVEIVTSDDRAQTLPTPPPLPLLSTQRVPPPLPNRL